METRNKTLLELTQALYISGDCFSLYEFAQNYLMGNIACGLNDSNVFFAMMTDINNAALHDSLDVNQKRALGVTGKSKVSVIKDWSSAILHYHELRDLTIKQLHYVMGYGARLSKIAAAEGSTREFKPRTPPVQSFESKTKQNASTVYKCPSCGEMVDLETTLRFSIKQKCPKCGKKVMFAP